MEACVKNCSVNEEEVDGQMMDFLASSSASDGVGKRVREVWLTSLTDLRIFEFLWIVSNGKLKIFYQ
eukprot:scaffold6903_cov191-Ochromonas_danica.AAC.1